MQQVWDITFISVRVCSFSTLRINSSFKSVIDAAWWERSCTTTVNSNVITRRQNQEHLFCICTNKKKIEKVLPILGYVEHCVTAFGCTLRQFIQAAVYSSRKINWSTWGLMCCVWVFLNTSFYCTLLPAALRKLMNSGPAGIPPHIYYKQRNHISPFSILLPVPAHTSHTKRKPRRKLSKVSH